jgi:hypothetical protein
MRREVVDMKNSRVEEDSGELGGDVEQLVRRPYLPPAIREEVTFETEALACVAPGQTCGDTHS